MKSLLTFVVDDFTTVYLVSYLSVVCRHYEVDIGD
jgi:hypothetical protein